MATNVHDKNEEANGACAYHAAVWNEPVVMQLGSPGRRGQVFPEPEDDVAKAAGPPSELVPKSMRREDPPALPEMTEPEVQRHYLHLSQETLGMMGISLFGTCTMKYNSRLGEIVAGRPELAEVHPLQPPGSIQGVLEIIHSFDLILRELSGMDQFIFQAGGGADAAYTHCVVTRAYHAHRGELEQRNEIITSIQAHPCNSATAAAAGFKVVTLPLSEKGYPELEALKAAVSRRTAALLINNPDDMGIYNPEIKEWTGIVREAGGLCFYGPCKFQRSNGKGLRSRTGIRCLHVHAAQNIWCAERRRRPCRGRLWMFRRISAVFAWSIGRQKEEEIHFGSLGPKRHRESKGILRKCPASSQGLRLGAINGCGWNKGRLRPFPACKQLPGQKNFPAYAAWNGPTRKLKAGAWR